MLGGEILLSGGEVAFVGLFWGWEGFGLLGGLGFGPPAGLVWSGLAIECLPNGEMRRGAGGGGTFFRDISGLRGFGVFLFDEKDAIRSSRLCDLFRSFLSPEGEFLPA